MFLQLSSFYLLGSVFAKNIGRQVAAGHSSTGFSPRPMLMGAPNNALRAFNSGVSLRCQRSWPTNCQSVFRQRYRSLSPKGRSWRICRAACFDTVRTCLPYAIFKVLYLSCKSARKASFVSKGLSLRMHRTPFTAARKGNAPLFTGTVYAALTISKLRIFVISLISSRFRFSSSTHRCCTPFSS